jgi:hypothetical protein
MCSPFVRDTLSFLTALTRDIARLVPLSFFFDTTVIQSSSVPGVSVSPLRPSDTFNTWDVDTGGFKVYVLP